MKETTKQIMMETDAFFKKQGSLPTTANWIIKSLEIAEDKFKSDAIAAVIAKISTEKEAEDIIIKIADNYNFRIEIY